MRALAAAASRVLLLEWQDPGQCPILPGCRVSFVALFALALLGRSRPWLCSGVAAWALAVALSRAIMG